MSRDGFGLPRLPNSHTLERYPLTESNRACNPSTQNKLEKCATMAICLYCFFFFGFGSEESPRVSTVQSNAGRAPFFVWLLGASLPQSVARAGFRPNVAATWTRATLAHACWSEKLTKKLSEPFRFPASGGEVGAARTRIQRGKLMSQTSHASIIKTLHILVYEIRAAICVYSAEFEFADDFTEATL